MRLLGIAFRNLLRAKRRNALAGGSMALGAAALVLGNGLSDGIAKQLTASLVAVQTGHVQVVVRPDGFERQNSPFDAYGQELIPGGVALAQKIEKNGGSVDRALPFLHGEGTATSGSRSSLAIIVGIDPAREAELKATQAVESGTFLPVGDDSAVYVGSPVARKLRLSVGDSLTLVVQTPQGAVNSLDAVVCGIFRKGAPWFDNTFYISLPAAQSLFDGPGSATNIKVFLKNPSRTRQALPGIAALAGEPSLPKENHLKVESHEEAGRFSFSIIQANESALGVLSVFLFLAAAGGIVNSMLMSGYERTREIGTIRALGMRRTGVVRLFLLEGLALGLVSAVVGVALGGAIVLYYGSRGIPMNMVSLTWMAGGDELFPILRGVNALRSGVAILLLSVTAAVYPAFIASRLEPREALQHV